MAHQLHPLYIVPSFASLLHASCPGQNVCYECHLHLLPHCMQTTQDKNVCRWWDHYLLPCSMQIAQAKCVFFNDLASPLHKNWPGHFVLSISLFAPSYFLSISLAGNSKVCCVQSVQLVMVGQRGGRVAKGNFGGETYQFKLDRYFGGETYQFKLDRYFGGDETHQLKITIRLK